MVPDGEELSLVTPLPSQPYEDQAFPTRPTLPLLPSSPTVKLHTRPPHPDVFPTWEDDYDLENMMPLEPTELLLPDMNSLEYYTNLLAREREGLREGDREGPSEREGLKKPEQGETKEQEGEGTGQRAGAKEPEKEGPKDQGRVGTPNRTDSKPPPFPPPRSTPPPVWKPKRPSLSPTTPLTLPPAPTGEVKPTATVRPPLSPPAPRPSNRPERPPAATERPDKTSTTSLTRAPPVTTPRVAQAPPTRQYLCNVTKPEMYLVRVGKMSCDRKTPVVRQTVSLE